MAQHDEEDGDGHQTMPRVLVVDDNEFNRRLLSDYLGAKGFEVRAASDGQSALQLAEEWKPDVLLLDVMMPYTDGFELGSAMRAMDSLKNTPLFYVTAAADKTIEERAKALGAVAVITKPFRLVDVEASIRRALDES